MEKGSVTGGHVRVSEETGRSSGPRKTMEWANREDELPRVPLGGRDPEVPGQAVRRRTD